MGLAKQNSKTYERNVLRKRVLHERNTLSPGQIIQNSASITSQLVALPEISQSNSCLVYMDFRSEVQTTGLLKELITSGKTVSAPCTLVATHEIIAVHITDIDNQVGPGYCGIPEPLPERVQNATIDPQTLDVVLVPGSVFDRKGGRLGYGGGYYDRFFANSAPQARRIGLAFELQLIERVPVEPHDQLMDYVVTEKAIYDCRRYRHAQDSSLPG